MIGIEGSCFFNTAAHRDVIQASCYPMVSKINCTTIVFKKFCITTPDKEDPNLFSKEKGSDFCFWRRARRTTKASAAHDRAASAQVQCAADAYFFAVPPLLMGKSGHRLRFDVICRNTPAFLAPLCGATVEQSETERFYPTSFLYALRTLLREMDLSGANWSLLFQSMMPASTHHCAALAVSGSATSTKAGVPMG